MKSLKFINDLLSNEDEKQIFNLSSKKSSFFDKDFINSIVLSKENVVISGFAGSGKTTLLKEILNNTPRKKWLIICQNKDEKEFSSKNFKNKNCQVKSWFDLAFEEIKQKKQWVKEPNKKISEKIFGFDFKDFKISWHLALEFCSSKEERIELFLNKKTNFNEKTKEQTLKIWNYWNSGDENSFAPFDWIIKVASLHKKFFNYDGILIDDFQETSKEKINLLFSENFGLSDKKIIIFEDKMKNLYNFHNKEKEELILFKEIILKESYDVSIDFIDKLNFLIEKAGFEERLIIFEEKLKETKEELDEFEIILDFENIEKVKSKRFKKVFLKKEGENTNKSITTKKISTLYVALSRSKNILLDEKAKFFVDNFFKKIDKNFNDDGF